MHLDRRDVFVSRIGANGTSLLFSTLLATSSEEYTHGVAVNGSRIYVTGDTDSTSFPVVSALQPTTGGNTDAFLVAIADGGEADLRIAVTPPVSMQAGIPATFTVTITNDGPAAVAGRLNLTLPALPGSTTGASLGSITPPAGWTCPSCYFCTTRLPCSTPAVAIGSSVFSISLTMPLTCDPTPPAAFGFVLSTPATTDPDPTSNLVTALVPILASPKPTATIGGTYTSTCPDAYVRIPIVLTSGQAP